MIGKRVHLHSIRVKNPKIPLHTQYIGIFMINLWVHINSIRVDISKMRNIRGLYVHL